MGMLIWLYIGCAVLAIEGISVGYAYTNTEFKFELNKFIIAMSIGNLIALPSVTFVLLLMS